MTGRENLFVLRILIHNSVCQCNAGRIDPHCPQCIDDAAHHRTGNMKKENSILTHPEFSCKLTGGVLREIFRQSTELSHVDEIPTLRLQKRRKIIINNDNIRKAPFPQIQIRKDLHLRIDNLTDQLLQLGAPCIDMAKLLTDPENAQLQILCRLQNAVLKQ